MTCWKVVKLKWYEKWGLQYVSLIGAIEAFVYGHELTHQAIFKYYGVVSRIEMGFFYGKTIPGPYSLSEMAFNSMWQAHCINEIIILPSLILLLILWVIIWKGVK